MSSDTPPKKESLSTLNQSKKFLEELPLNEKEDKTKEKKKIIKLYIKNNRLSSENKNNN